MALACLPGPHTLGLRSQGSSHRAWVTLPAGARPRRLTKLALASAMGAIRGDVGVLIRLLSPHPSEGVSDWSLVAQTQLHSGVPDVLFVILTLLPGDVH